VINRDVFFGRARVTPFGGLLHQEQVDGCNAILAAWEAVSDVIDPRWIAYALATAFKETNRTMQPVREAYYLGEPRAETYRKTLRYYPFYGRGYVQTTWEDNYRKFGKLLGIDLVTAPDRALEPVIAAQIMVKGMIGGLFTGVGLARYFNNHTDDPVDARRIINGTDCADEIAGYHAGFLAAVS
jgi:predicted chitinase